MVSLSHGVAQHISSTVFPYAKYMLSKKVIKTFEKTFNDQFIITQKENTEKLF